MRMGSSRAKKYFCSPADRRLWSSRSRSMPPRAFPRFPRLAVIDGPAGTSKLIFTRSGNGSPASLYSFDSSDVNDANPTATEIDIASPDQQVELGDLTAVGSQVYFTTNANESSTVKFGFPTAPPPVLSSSTPMHCPTRKGHLRS